jgi:catechol 2,3-dioxygenase-like lactoylglutathione lyase family enzyme
MKRMHVHIAVGDLATAKRFYTAMFGQEPTVSKPDYAKWSLEDPRINLAISQKLGNQPGIDHLGIQAETAEELEELYERLGDASYAMLEQRGAKCCYAESDKHWAVDPEGVTWEMFHSLGEVEVYGLDRAQDVENALGARGQ